MIVSNNKCEVCVRLLIQANQCKRVEGQSRVRKAEGLSTQDCLYDNVMKGRQQIRVRKDRIVNASINDGNLRCLDVMSSCCVLNNLMW